MGPSFNLTKVTKYCNICDTILLNQTCVPSLWFSKDNLLSLGCGEGKSNVYCRHQTRTASAVAQKTQNSCLMSTIIIAFSLTTTKRQ